MTPLFFQLSIISPPSHVVPTCHCPSASVVIPTGVEESLASFCFGRAECQKEVRDVSTSLDMTPAATEMRNVR